jgi:hypothetical protein
MRVGRNEKRKARPTAGEAPEPEAARELESPPHEEWLLDEALEETFPASDPISPKNADDLGSSKHPVSGER